VKTELPLDELKEQIKQHMDELQLLEILDITVEELVDLLEIQIEDKYDELMAVLPDDVGEQS
jgi:hypothetical protein